MTPGLWEFLAAAVLAFAGWMLTIRSRASADTITALQRRIELLERELKEAKSETLAVRGELAWCRENMMLRPSRWQRNDERGDT